MKTNKKPSQKSIEARKELIALSLQANAKIELLEATTGESLGVNEMLIIMHTQSTGGEIWRTFHDWKKEGFKVKGKETASRIWGKPIKANKKATAGSELEPADEGGKFKMFPMCCIFNENQVEAMEV